MRGTSELCLLLTLALVCAAQAAQTGTAGIRKVKVMRVGDEIKLEVVLTAPVTPRLTLATNPDRLVLDFPNTIASARQRRIAVNRSGVTRVRVGLTSRRPLVTRAVVDLDAVHPYQLTNTGDVVTLTVLPVSAAALGRPGDGPVPTATGSLWGKLWARPGAPSSKASHANSRAAIADESTSPDANLHVSFQLKYVAEGAAYLIGGRSSGLSVGMKLVVHDGGSGPTASATPQGPVVAELEIVSLAETSAVTEIHNPQRDLKPGEWAELSPEDSAKLEEQPKRGANGIKAQPPLTGVRLWKPQPRAEDAAQESRIRARVGLDFSGINSSGSTAGRSGTMGLALSVDASQIAGSHWNLQGYWRDRLTTNSQPNEDTLQDYLDRTYTIQLFYENPNSKWVAGFGRLYLPWAVSLDTIDGGYVGRKVARGVTAGIFFGSTPDPTSWHYRPDQRIGGSFINFEGGSYDDLHYTSTAGVALSTVKWQLDRPYVFLENGLSYRKSISVYHSLIVDSPQGASTDGIKPGTGISRSYLSLRFQPREWVSFDVFHNYFRDVPTAATALIGTGLVDKLLYQGVNVGVRFEPLRRFAVYTSVGRSNKTGDAKQSLNQMYGATWDEIWRTGIRADFRYSKFDSNFARGDYRILSLSRHLGNRVMWDVQAGNETLNSVLTVNQRSLFADTSFDINLGTRTFLQSGYTIARGAQLNYAQWHLSLGYRLDVKGQRQ